MKAQDNTTLVGFRIHGPAHSVLFIPDIDRWEQFDAMGSKIETLIAAVDVAFLDGTFFANGEIPGRDMSGFPHPFIRQSMARFQSLPAATRAKIHFIHLNHTNPALWPGTPQRSEVEKAGFHIADEGERIEM